MKLPVVVSKQRLRFYDGGDPRDADGVGSEPADPTTDVVVVLDRRLLTDEGGQIREAFLLRRRIGYADRHCGEIIVPPRYESFPTDLTSVPALFTWLVPKTGAHLPAALLHDGLVWDPAKESKTYISTEGTTIDRVEVVLAPGLVSKEVLGRLPAGARALHLRAAQRPRGRTRRQSGCAGAA